MLGTVFHYAVVEPKADHAQCDAQRQGIIAYHERNGYRQGGAYNGHFCIHGGTWLSYEGPNQATGNTWANLNLEAWCYLGTVDTPVTPEAQQAAFDLTLRNPRDRIHPHSDFFQTSCWEFIRKAHARNMAVHYWTVNDPAEMRRLIAIGADGLITDYPDRLKSILSEPQR